LNAVEFAERMQDGGTADLSNAVERITFLLRRIHEGDHKALENALEAAMEAEAILAKVKGGAS
jgi:hypothetical protein